MFDSVEMVQTLLKRGANINRLSKSGYTALTVAIRSGPKSALVLLDAGADVTIPAEDDLYSPLRCARTVGDTHLVKLILEAGANVNVNTRCKTTGSSVVEMASSYGHEAVVKVLLEAGADLSSRNVHGSALSLAAQKGHIGTVHTLLEAGMAVNSQGGILGNALCAASLDGHYDVVCFLLEKGANVNAHGGRCGSAVLAACRRHNRHIARHLLSYGADPNIGWKSFVSNARELPWLHKDECEETFELLQQHGLTEENLQHLLSANVLLGSKHESQKICKST